MSKKYLSDLIIVVILVSLMTGCSYFADIEYYRDIENYSEIWELEGFSYGFDGELEELTLFPKEISNLKINDYYCRHGQNIPFGESIQIYLEVQYEDDETFKTELERISNIGFQCNDYFEESDYYAYATRTGENYAWDYALVVEENKIIRYIYLESMKKEEIEFSYDLLPKDFEKYGENGKIN